jgi:fructose/tagatose bisphosphate aldolase
MTYDIARLLLKLTQEQRIGPLIFELARSEMEYTDQRPDEFAVAVLAAAIKEGYRGPLCLQADHVQANAGRYREDPAMETQNMKHLIKEALDGGFHQIDIDASTIVDLTKATLDEQQAANYTMTASLTAYIRALDTGVMTSISGEIGHIGGKIARPKSWKLSWRGMGNT